MKKQPWILAAALALMPALSSAWTLEPETSTVSFGSIKNDLIGEAHTFGSLSGSVGDDGEVIIEIGLASVQTNIDVRNERMIAHVFGDAATAKLTTAVELAEFEALGVGESEVIPMDATLSFLGTETTIYFDMFVMRVGEDRLLATTNAPAYIATADLEIEEGLNTLQELAGLDGITRVTPVTARFVFAR